MRFALLIGIVAWCATNSINAAPNSSGVTALRSVIDSVNTFSLKLFKVAAAEHKNNLICAPVDVSTLLSMAYYGAGGDTKKQIRKGLALSENDVDTKAGFQNMLNGLKEYPLVDHGLAHQIFVDKSIEVQSDFKTMIKKVFDSKVQSLNFKDSAQASSVINKWSEDNTNGAIKDIVKPADVDSKTSLVLASSVYFNGAWASPFPISETKDRPFHINAKETINIPTMYQNQDFEYGKIPRLDADLVLLPYQEKNSISPIYMALIRPNAIDGLAKVIENLDTLTMDELHDTESTECNVYLPKFRITSELSLKNTLTTMDMTDMFKDKLSDFTGITGSPSIPISKIVQKAIIDVDETGSKPEGLPYLPLRDMPHTPVDFRVDRPFVALIVATPRSVVRPMILFAAAWDGRN